MARKLEVIFFGIRPETRGSHGRQMAGPVHVNVKVFEQVMQLDGEKEYLDEQYAFKIEIPLTIRQDKPHLIPVSENVVTTDHALSQSEFDALRYPVTWLVNAQLDVPNRLDIMCVQRVFLRE